MNWKSKICEAYGVLGMNNVILSNNGTAIFFLKKSLQIAEDLNDYRQIALASGTLGNVYYFQSNFPQAIEYYLESLKGSEKSKDKNGEAATLSNIGAIYNELNELDKALPYFEKALKLNIETDFKIYQAINLSNIATVYSKKGKEKLALSFLYKALAVNKEINELPGLASVMNAMSSNYISLNDLDSSLYCASNARKISKQIESKTELGLSYYNIASIYQKAATLKTFNFSQNNRTENEQKYLHKAAQYADSSKQIYSVIQNQELLAKVYKLLSELQNSMGNCNAALENYMMYMVAHDSVYNAEVNKKLTQKTMQYDFDKKEAITKAEQEKKDAISIAEKARSKQQKLILILGLFLAIFFGAWDYKQKQRISKQKKRSDELLLNILPAEVAEELKAKGSAEAQQIDEVTVLFTDFKGFTQLSEKLTPKELVAEINECFSAFDYIMEKHGVEKIKTIGDAYMAAGGLPTANNTHAENVVNAALEIQTFMQNHKAKKLAAQELFFEIRIGIHTGPVVAGIVGVKKFAYDIWGDTVNTASRMESSGEVGKVNISETTFALVKDKFNCVHRGKVQAKGKGEIDMYFVQG